MKAQAMVVSKVNGILQLFGLVGLPAFDSEIARIDHETAEI
jgi:hypothetical protein